MPVDEQGREYDESWDPSSGLIDDVDAEIVGHRFGYVEAYKDRDGSPQCLSILTLQVLDDKGHPDGETIEQSWSCGSGWEPSDDGKVALHTSGKRKFVKTSMYARLTSRIAQLYPDVRMRGVADKVGPLVGLVFHWDNEKFSYGGEIGDREHLMPTKFLRVNEAGTKTGDGAARGGDDLMDDLTALALTTDNHQAFVKALTADKPLIAKVRAAGKLREALDSTPGGAWARARSEAGL